MPSKEAPPTKKTRNHSSGLVAWIYFFAIFYGLYHGKSITIKHHHSRDTLPETNISLQLDPLEARRFLLETHPFLGAKMLVSGSVTNNPKNAELVEISQF